MSSATSCRVCKNSVIYYKKCRYQQLNSHHIQRRRQGAETGCATAGSSSMSAVFTLSEPLYGEKNFLPRTVTLSQYRMKYSEPSWNITNTRDMNTPVLDGRRSCVILQLWMAKSGHTMEASYFCFHVGTVERGKYTVPGIRASPGTMVIWNKMNVKMNRTKRCNAVCAMTMASL